MIVLSVTKLVVAPSCDLLQFLTSKPSGYSVYCTTRFNVKKFYIPRMCDFFIWN
jgi:hypothetical protein